MVMGFVRLPSEPLASGALGTPQVALGTPQVALGTPQGPWNQLGVDLSSLDH